MAGAGRRGHAPRSPQEPRSHPSGGSFVRSSACRVHPGIVRSLGVSLTLLLLARPALADGTLWVNVAGRFLSDPQNPNYQEPRLEWFDGDTFAPLGGFASDDRDRAIAQGPDGNLYAATSILNDESEIRIWDRETGTILDTFGSWKGSPVDIAFGPQGTLFVQVAARFFSDPQNPNYQEPLLDEYDPATGQLLDRWVRNDDRERDIAVDSDGNVYAVASIFENESVVRVYPAGDRSTPIDTIGSWKGTPVSIEIGPGDILYVQVQARFFGDPQNPNYQAPQLDLYDPSSGLLVDSFERAADNSRQIAVGDDGTVFVGTAPVADEAHVDVYDASDLGTVFDTLGSWKAGFRDIAFVPEPGSGGMLAALGAMIALTARRSLQRRVARSSAWRKAPRSIGPTSPS